MKKFIAAALAAISLTTLPAIAQQRDGNTLQDHRELITALESVGVRTRLNDAVLCHGNNSGVYYSHFRLLVVCQDNAVTSDSATTWTANDLDTLRHEAHHVVQDCALGRLGDTQLTRLFQDPQQYNRFVNAALTPEQINRISQGYGSRGLNKNEVLIEVEAFAAAASVSAETIASKVVQFCS